MQAYRKRQALKIPNQVWNDSKVYNGFISCLRIIPPDFLMCHGGSWFLVVCLRRGQQNRLLYPGSYHGTQHNSRSSLPLRAGNTRHNQSLSPQLCLISAAFGVVGNFFQVPRILHTVPKTDQILFLLHFNYNKKRPALYRAFLQLINFISSICRTWQ